MRVCTYEKYNPCEMFECTLITGTPTQNTMLENNTLCDKRQHNTKLRIKNCKRTPTKTKRNEHDRRSPVELLIVILRTRARPLRYSEHSDVAGNLMVKRSTKRHRRPRSSELN